ncbi:substrate-binding domain-containing protein [Corynebacterium sp. ES2730-CONJ]|uniref:substrate-binding domain-containing protein n=1 Tax=Corynebacterium sp. ES2730-CONJ TaxID=2973941 RepID=UPI00216AE9E8|nr:substrate-binding domain-containing protein [Corynebacterium sp. ES2730-CONJ]MCS4532306.1 substrate-binding domain-containing protein [Corynebacterium sp. ES2730-CONJ]
MAEVYLTRKISLVASFVAAITLITGCSATGGLQEKQRLDAANGHADTPRLVVAMVTHGAPGDTFWDLVRKGAEDAARKGNIELRYSSDPQAPNQANLIQAAIDSDVDGLALTMPNADALGPVAARASAAGIPTVALNAGMNRYQEFNISSFFGQEEKLAGLKAGERLAATGAEHVLCVIHEQGNSSQESRCQGVAEGLGKEVDLLYVNGQELTNVQATLGTKLAQDKNIEWIMSLQAPVALRAVEAVKETQSAAKIATFDTNAQLMTAINNDQIAFAVDQQPYLQGYLAIDSLWLAHRNGSVMGGERPVLTGPSFITPDNIDQISDAASGGFR